MIVDISQYQGNINWDIARNYIDLVIFRASIDLRNDEKYYDYTKKCNIPFGVYHFLKAKTQSDAAAEAKFFYSAATSNGLRPLFFCADVECEWQDESNLKVITETFAKTLRSLGVKKLGLYIGQIKYPYAARELYDFIWIPRYGKNSGNVEQEYSPKYPCDLWQYTSNGHINGITERVDLNILYGDKSLNYFLQKGDDTMSDKVMVGSARGDENNSAHGGQAGDQTSYELSTQEWYNHPKKWRVFRPRNIETAEKIAWNMQAACDNNYIGYDQYQRDTLYEVAEKVGFNCSKVTTNCETDCSALVRVCCAYAGINLSTFNTETEPSILLKSGAFIELTGKSYTDNSDYLLRGDILDTATKGHTVVVLSNGSKVFDINLLGVGTLRKGSKGEAVKQLQNALNLVIETDLNIDGDFGSATEAAVKSFQKKFNLEDDGVYGPMSNKVLLEQVEKLKIEPEPQPEPTPIPEPEPEPTEKTLLTTGNVNIRTGDNADYSIIESVVINTKLIPILDKDEKPIISANNWYAVKTANQIGWVSGKFISANN